jgi:hypothetical protein
VCPSLATTLDRELWRTFLPETTLASALISGIEINSYRWTTILGELWKTSLPEPTQAGETTSFNINEFYLRKGTQA